jgi:hypothetical protein
LNVHPVTATGRQVIWLQSFERKFSFLALDNPSMSNPACPRVFRCAAGTLIVAGKARRFNQLSGMSLRYAALHNEI